MRQLYQGYLEGERVTVNECNDLPYQGCYAVSVGIGTDLTTFIVHPTRGVVDVSTGGKDKWMWERLAILAAQISSQSS